MTGVELRGASGCVSVVVAGVLDSLFPGFFEMRGVKQAPAASTVARPAAAANVWISIVVSIISVLALLFVWRPTVVRAQGKPAVAAAASSAATTVHVVKPGETLWSLAARYYGDGHQWQELARRNKLATEGPSPLRVGMKLTVPVPHSASDDAEGRKAAIVAAAPADSSVPRSAVTRAGEGTLESPPPAAAAPRDAAKAAAKAAAADTRGVAAASSLASQTAGKSDAASAGRDPAAAAAAVKLSPGSLAVDPASDTTRLNLTPSTGRFMGGEPGNDSTVRIGLVTPADQKAARKPSEAETVFHRDIPDAEEAERRAQELIQPNRPVPRQAEYETAPFLLEELAAGNAGRVGSRLGTGARGAESVGHNGLIRTEEVEVEAPQGRSYEVGTRLVSYTLSRTPDGKKEVALPTGVLEVVAQGGSGQGTLAVVRQQSGRIEPGQPLLVIEGSAASRGESALLDSPDVNSRIIWMDRKSLLPTLQSFLIFDGGSTQGLRAGDEMALYDRAGAGGAESLIATVRLVRVGEGWSTGIVEKQYDARISSNLVARRFSKMR